MDEYISREELIKALEADYDRSWCSKPQGVEEYVEGARDEYDDVLKIVCGMKAADVQPVKHAYWIELPKALNPNENPCKCSNCGHILSFMNYYPKSKYCPNCGARMDKEG